MRNDALSWWVPAKPRDTGLGDNIARILAPIGGNRFKAWRKRSGKPCNCAKRQKAINAAEARFRAFLVALLHKQ